MNKLASCRLIRNCENIENQHYRSIGKHHNENIRRNNKANLTDKKQIHTAHFFQMEKTENMTEINKKFSKIYQFITWAEKEEDYLYQFQAAICLNASLQLQQVIDDIEQPLKNRQTNQIFKGIIRQIQQNIMLYIDQNPKLKIKIKDLHYEMIKTRNSIVIDKKRELQKCDYLSKMKMILRSSQKKCKIVEYCLLTLHFVSSNLGSYPAILNYFQSTEIGEILLQQFRNTNYDTTYDFKSQIFKRVATIICMVFMKYNKVPNFKNNSKYFLSQIIQLTIQHRIHVQNLIDNTQNVELGTSRFKNMAKQIQKMFIRKNIKFQIKEANTTIYLIYKHLQNLTKQFYHNDPTHSQNQAHNLYRILAIIANHRKVLNIYLKRVQFSYQQHKASHPPQFYLIDRKKSHKKSKYDIDLFKSKINNLINILNSFQKCFWEESKKDIIQQLHHIQQNQQGLIQRRALSLNNNSKNGIQNKRSSTLSKKSKISVAYKNKFKSLTCLLQSDNEDVKVSKWASQKFFKNNILLTKNEQTRYKDNKKQKICSDLINNKFENAKNAIQQINIQMKLKKQAKPQRQGQKKMQTKKKCLNRQKRQKIYQLFRNNKKMVHGLSINSINQEIQDINQFHFFDKKQDNANKKQNIANYYANITEMDQTLNSNYQKSIQNTNEHSNNRDFSTNQTTLRIIKYINMKPTTIQIQMSLLQTIYKIQICLMIDHEQKNIQILLPKSHHIFTGRFQTIWPTLKYFFKKKIMQYWVFSQHQDSFQVFNMSKQASQNKLKHSVMISKQELINLFGVVTEEQLEQISGALCYLSKFIDIILFKTNNYNGSRILMKQIFNERVSNICLLRKIVSHQTQSFSKIKQVIDYKKSLRNIHCSLVNMKENTFLLRNQKIVLGTSILKTKQKYLLLTKKVKQKYCFVSLSIFAKDLLQSLYENSIKVNLSLKPIKNEQNKQENQGNIQKSKRLNNFIKKQGCQTRTSGFARSQKKQSESSKFESLLKIKVIHTNGNLKNNSNYEDIDVQITKNILQQNGINMVSIFQAIKQFIIRSLCPYSLFQSLLSICLGLLNLSARFQTNFIKTQQVQNTVLTYKSQFYRNTEASGCHDRKIVENCFDFEEDNNTMYCDISQKQNQSKYNNMIVQQYYKKSYNTQKSNNLGVKIIQKTFAAYQAKQYACKNKQVQNKNTNRITCIHQIFSMKKGQNYRQKPKKLCKQILMDNFHVILQSSISLSSQKMTKIIVYFYKFKSLFSISLFCQDLNILANLFKLDTKQSYHIVSEMLKYLIIDRQTIIPKIALSFNQFNIHFNFKRIMYKNQYYTSTDTYKDSTIQQISLNKSLLHSKLQNNNSIKIKSPQKRIQNINKYRLHQDISKIREQQISQSLNSMENQSNQIIQQKYQNINQLSSLRFSRYKSITKYLISIPYRFIGIKNKYMIISLKIICRKQEDSKQIDGQSIFAQIQLFYRGININLSIILEWNFLINIIQDINKDDPENVTAMYNFIVIFMKQDQFISKRYQNSTKQSQYNKSKVIFKDFLLKVHLCKVNQKYLVKYNDINLGQITTKVCSQFNQEQQQLQYIILDSTTLLDCIFQNSDNQSLSKTYAHYQLYNEIRISQNIENSYDTLKLLKISLKETSNNVQNDQQQMLQAQVQKQNSKNRIICGQVLIQTLIRNYKVEDQYINHPQKNISISKLTNYYLKKTKAQF